MDKGKSLVRTNEDVITLGDILLKEGLGTILPGYGLVHELTKLMLGQVQQYNQGKLESRIQKFHEALLTDKVDDFSAETGEAFLQKEFSMEDYHALLESCARDLEEEKSELYGNLMRSLIDRKIAPSKRREFILLVRDLGIRELKFLRVNYIRSKYAVRTLNGFPVSVDKVTNSPGAPCEQIADKLIYHGLVDKQKEALNRLAMDFVEHIYPEPHLTPDSIGLVQPSGVRILIISYRLDDERNLKAANALSDALWKYKKITSSMIALTRGKSRAASLTSNAGVLLVDDFDRLDVVW